MKKHIVILIIACIIAISIVTIVGSVKLSSHAYNAIDLSIYSQVLWNTSHGDFFLSTIQDTNYIGDHVELWLYPLSFIYRIIPSPLLLVVLQAVALFGSAIFVYYLSRRHFSDNQSLTISLLFLINPIIWNMALFEFHMLPFFIPLFLGALYFYLEKKYTPFIIFTLASLFIREDVALILIGMSFLSFYEKRKLKWWGSLAILGVTWFAVTMLISRAINTSGYKFTVYYSWLGTSFSEIISTIFTRPLYVLANLLSFNDILFIVAMFLIFFLLPIWRLRYLIPTIFIAAELIIPQFSTSILLQTHYTSLLIPFFVVASIEGLPAMLSWLRKKYSILFEDIGRKMLIITVHIVALFTLLTIGPIISGINEITTYDTSYNKEKTSLLESIPSDASVYASYNALTALANRKHLYALHYALPGKKQFSEDLYIAEQKPTHMVLNLEDLSVTMLKQKTESDRKDTSQNILNLLSDYTLRKKVDNMLLLTTHQKGEKPFSDILAEKTDLISPLAKQIGSIGAINVYKEDPNHFEKTITLAFSASEKIDLDDASYFFRIHQGTHQTELPFAWGLYIISDISPNEIITMTIPLTNHFDLTEPMLIELTSAEGYALLEGLRSQQLVVEHTVIASVEITPK